jgi:ribonuclease VapC
MVLDASALLAHLRREPGSDAVTDAIGRGATISAVNLAEVLSRAGDRGADPEGLAGDLTEAGLLHGAVVVEPFTAEDAAAVARLRSATRGAGLSLGDRACLALGERLEAPVLTADRAWSELDVSVDVLVFR